MFVNHGKAVARNRAALQATITFGFKQLKAPTWEPQPGSKAANELVNSETRADGSPWGEEPVRTAYAARGDLLAQTAGLALGTAEGRGAEYRAQARAVAELCLMAGADEALIARWTETGRERAAQAACRHSAGRVVRPGAREQVASRTSAEWIFSSDLVKGAEESPELSRRLMVSAVIRTPLRWTGTERVLVSNV